MPSASVHDSPTAAHRDPGGARLRVGLLGAGAISEEHAGALRRIPFVETAAVCDLSEPRARALAASFGIPGVHASLDAMIEEERLDVVHVLTPPQTHFSLAARVVELGCHVFVEKPIALAVSDAAELKDRAARKGRLVGVNYNALYPPALGSLIDLVRDCRIGELQHVTVSFVTPPASLPLRDAAQFMFQERLNMIFELGPHPMSIIHRLMGRALQVSAVASVELAAAGGKRFCSTWQVNAITERGTAQLYLSAGRSFRDVTVSAFGEDGIIHADLLRHAVTLHENTNRRIYGDLFQSLANARRLVGGTLLPLIDRPKRGVGRPVDVRLHGMAASIESFYTALRDGRKIPNDVDAGIAVVEYCEQARNSAARAF